AGASVAGTSLVLASRPGDAAAGSPADDPWPQAVACFGHVDVERGGASLHPVPPGRGQQGQGKEKEEGPGGPVLLSVDKRVAECLVRQARADVDAALAQRDKARKLIEQQKLREEQQLAVLDAVRHRLRAAESLLSRKAELRGVQVNDKEVAAAEAQ